MRLPLFVACCLVCLFGCSKSEPVTDTVPAKTADPAPAEPGKAEPLKQYELRGEVVSLDPEGHIAKIKHQAIGDWMGAMTMEFPVKDPADFAKLTAGKPVRATVNVQGFNYWVSGVQDSSVSPSK